MKFKMDTLAQRSTVYNGPSGENYVIYQGQPFEVTDKQDIDFFKNNNRFSKSGRADKPSEDVEKVWLKELKDKGLSASEAKKVVGLYHSVDDLQQDVTDEAYHLDPSLKDETKVVLLELYAPEHPDLELLKSKVESESKSKSKSKSKSNKGD